MITRLTPEEPLLEKHIQKAARGTEEREHGTFKLVGQGLEIKGPRGRVASCTNPLTSH